MSDLERPPDWYDAKWAHRVPITINHEMVTGSKDPIDFPLKVDHRHEGFRTAQPTGDDFLFVAEDGSKLSHEIVSWDPLQCRLVAYVRIPRLSTTHDTVFFLYWGNPEAEDQRDVEGTWDQHYVLVKHLSDTSTHPRKHGAKGGSLARKAYFELQIRILEDLYGADWFRNPSRKTTLHPAYAHWRFCTDAFRTGNIVQAGTLNDLQRATAKSAEVLRDTASLVQCTKGEVSNFRLGDLANYGDEMVVHRLRNVLPDPSQFEDVLAELKLAACYISKGYRVRVSEAPGHPDFEITVPGWDLPILADSKRISGAALKNNINRHVKKANKQIKSTGKSAYGLVFLNITAALKNPRTLSDSIPEEVVQVQDYLRKELSVHCASLSGAVLVWDELAVLGPEPNSPFVMAVLRTRSLVVRHRDPLYALPLDLQPVDFGSTIEVSSHGESAAPIQSTALSSLWQRTSSTLSP